MYRVLKASKDGYITNKVISNKFRATDANVGQASSLDLFKLYEESTLPGTGSGVIELSRVLIKFDLDPLRALTGSILNYTDSSFNCTMKLYNAYGGQTIPSNFKLIVYPLSRSFDEGFGRDIVTFSDLDACNYITSSYSDGSANVWYMSGAHKEGLLGSSDIDLIASGNLSDGNGVVNLWKEQTFTSGDEDLSLDITTIVSATLSSQIPDEGFLIAFSGSYETDTNTYFIKRFPSRHHSNTRITPRILVRYNDSLQDDTSNFYFDLTGSVFLNNYHRGQPANILSGASLTQITGSNSLILKIESGSFITYATGSQVQYGTNIMSGVYSSSFVIRSDDTSTISGTQRIKDFVEKSGSITFDTTWTSLDLSVPYLSGTLKINKIERNSFYNTRSRYIVSIENCASVFKSTDKIRFRVSVFDRDNSIVMRKKPLIDVSEILNKMYYRVKDENSDEIVIPFDDDSGKNATRLSTDTKGMYFDFYMSDLDIGRLYSFEFMIKDHGVNEVFDNTGMTFRIDP
jgi:hypothetical protein